MRSLQEPVQLVYFYQKDNPAGRAAVTMLELLGRLNPQLAVEVVDIDRNPARAGALGVQLYNTAVIVAATHRVQVADDRRPRDRARHPACAAPPASPSSASPPGMASTTSTISSSTPTSKAARRHSHNSEGIALVQMEQHGLGRLRRAVEKLGLDARKVELRPGRPLPEHCAALIDANPRTPHLPAEADLLRAYLARGGNYMLLVEPDFALEPRLAGVLAEAGARVGDGVIVDPVDHYFTDEQMIAITRYANHPVTRAQALSFYPGARPVEPAPRPRRERRRRCSPAARRATSCSTAMRYREEAASAPQAFLSAGRGGRGALWATASRPYRMIVVGDADFASNSFFPYLANSDIALAGVSWLLHEERLPTMKPPVEVLPTVTLTSAQVRWIFILTVLLLPGAVAFAGFGVWLWRRH